MEDDKTEQLEKHDVSEEKPVKSKKKYNKPVIVLGFLVLVFAGVAIFFGIKYFEPKEEPEPVTVNKIEKEVKVEIARETIAEDYKEVEDVVNTVTSGIENNQDYLRYGEVFMYKPEGLNTFVSMKFGIGKRIVNSNSVEANINTLKTKLENEGFSSIGLLPNPGSAHTPDEYGYLNSSRNIVCSVSEGDEWVSPSNGYEYAFLGCAKTDWVWLTEADKMLTSELEAAYREKEGEYPIVLNADTRKIKNSQTSPYQTITTTIKGAAGLFYRTSPDSKWQFFTGTQAVLDCGDYNTEDLKKAYLGEPCYNGSVESIVQL